MCIKKRREQNWNQIFSKKGRVFDEPLDEVKRFSIGLKKSGLTQVLDLGCGSGRHTIYLKQEDLHVWGLDNAPAGLKLTQTWLQAKKLQVPLILADVHDPFPFKEGSFDGLISTRVIHHATQEKVIGAVKEIIRVVRKGGMILITVPGGSKRENYHRWFGHRTLIKWIEPHTYIPLRGREKGIPHYIFTQEELSTLFEGFAELHIDIDEKQLIQVTARK
jgi:SAM-dependent methyltransferase